MTKNKKKLTKQERAQKQLAREELHRKAKQDLLNSIEAHQFNTGDLVRVGGKVGTIVSLNDNLLNNRWSIGKQAFEKVIDDFYALAKWWADPQKEEPLPPKVEEYLQEFIPTTHYVFNSWLEKEEFEVSIDVPIACFRQGDDWVVRARSLMFNKQKDQYLVFKGMFDAYNWLGMEGEENVFITEQNEGRGWYEATSDNREDDTVGGVFAELLDQAYAVKEKRSRNLGLYKVLYTGKMLGQKGKQQVWVAPCNIQAL